MYTLITRPQSVLYPSMTSPPALLVDQGSGSMTMPAMTMVGTIAVGDFQEECRLRRAETAGHCLRKPDEELVAMRRAPECPTSRYCPECPCG